MFTEAKYGPAVAQPEQFVSVMLIIGAADAETASTKHTSDIRMMRAPPTILLSAADDCLLHPLLETFRRAISLQREGRTAASGSAPIGDASVCIAIEPLSCIASAENGAISA